MSYERHNRMLKVEFNKTNKNYGTVKNLMDRTFALRRKDIMEHTYDLKTIFNFFPFLHESEQVCIVNQTLHFSQLYFLFIVDERT